MKKALFLFLTMVIAGCSGKQQTNYTVSQQNQSQEKQDIVAEFNAFANNNPIYFAFDSSKIEEKELINIYQEKMNELGNKVNYVVYGMCDNRGTDSYNDKLGLRRANALKNALNGKSNIEVKSYGKKKFKKYSNNTELNYQENRKAVITAVKSK